MSNVLFALYHDFSANSAVHVHNFANQLAAFVHSVCVAVPQAWIDVQSMADLDDVATAFRLAHDRKMRLATKYVNLTRNFFSAHGITDYLKSDGSLAEARKMANHADTRTTQLYDRRADVASLEEYNKVGI